ncbi:MAG: MFS transporter, partial [Desulfovibrionaceae bacterium]|nr:MFS transporter [Desulfovibrionaceae bacterium]
MNSRQHPIITQDLHAYAGLLVLTVCLYGLMYSPQALLNTISSEFGSGMTSSGMLIGVFMASLAVSPIFVGMLLDKTGVRRAILTSSAILAATSVLIYFAASFEMLMAVRCLQALFLPVGLTAIMSAIAAHFRHMDLARALAGYIACNLVGSVSARVLGGVFGELIGWRLTLAGFSVSIVIALVVLAFSLKDPQHHHGRLHTPKEYLSVFGIPGVPSLLFAEGCGIFVFAGMGNLIPFRMAELGQAGSGTVGLMYLGYAVGLVTSLWIKQITSFAGGPARLLAMGSFAYMAFLALLLIPSQYVLFAAIWLLALSEFIVHAL